MDAYRKTDNDERTSEAELPPEELLSLAGPGVPRPDEDHGEILRLLIGEGTDAALEVFNKAKDPNIDPALKAKLIGLGSRVGDNVRKAIVTHVRHFGGQG